MDKIVFEQCGKSVVRLHFNGAFQGSGFVINALGEECIIMTCAHVLRSLGDIDKTVNAYFPGENLPFGCKVLYGDEDLDLALLQSIPSARTFDSVAPLEFLAEPVTLKKDIVLLAFYTLDDGVTPMIQPGTSPGRIIAQPTDRTIVYSSSSKKGTSGGSIICSSGANMLVAGVHSQTSMGNSYGVPVTTIRAFLWGWVKSWNNVGDDHSVEDGNEMITLTIQEMLEKGPRLEEDQVE